MTPLTTTRQAIEEDIALALRLSETLMSLTAQRAGIYAIKLRGILRDYPGDLIEGESAREAIHVSNLIHDIAGGA
jgi:hypothetical protein